MAEREVVLVGGDGVEHNCNLTFFVHHDDDHSEWRATGYVADKNPRIKAETCTVRFADGSTGTLILADAQDGWIDWVGSGEPPAGLGVP